MKGKMLVFAKTSIQSFNYDLIVVFMFPNQTTQNIYDKYKIKKCLLMQNLTDTYSTSLSYIFIYYKGCLVKEDKTRDIIFKVMIHSKFLERLDVSHKFWERFAVRNKTVKKQVGIYEDKSIDYPTILTIAVNPKEYFEKYKDRTFNKKSKRIKKDTPGMDFEAYAAKLQPKEERFQIK